jgi:hypothetical protein
LDFALLTEFRFGPIFLNDGKGNFTTHDPEISVPDMATFMQAADLNNDGLPDFAVISETTMKILFLYNRGNLRFEPKEVTLSIDREGNLQVDSGGADETEGRRIKPMATKQAGKPAGRPAMKYGIGGIRHFAFTDINNDGKTDMVFPLTGPTRKLVVAENQGGEDFVFRSFEVPGEGPLTSVAVLKRKDSAFPLIAISQSVPGKVFLFRNDGKGNLTLSGSFDTGENILLRMAAADIDRDGNDSLILMYGAPLPIDSKSPVQIWKQGEDGNFILKEQFKSNGNAGHVSFCEFSPSERAVILSNMHEGTLTLRYIK